MRYTPVPLALLVLALFALAMTGGVATGQPAPKPVPGLEKIRHIIVISLSNRSFNNLFGYFPGADGIAQAGDKATQTGRDGKPHIVLPRAMDTRGKTLQPDLRFPSNLPNRPFAIETYAPADQMTGDPMHRLYQTQEQINGGRMDRFAAVSNVGGLTLGYYDGSKLGIWRYARQYTLADRFFSAAFGSSILNNFWLVCACTPRFEEAPEEFKVQLSDGGKLIKDAELTPDGYVIKKVFSIYGPRSDAMKKKIEINDNPHMLQPLDMPTIGDRLSEKNIGWAWYAGGWNDAVAQKADPSFGFHHQPFTYFRSLAEGSAARARHLKDEEDFLKDVKSGRLPAVAFYKPLLKYSYHAHFGTIAQSDAHLMKILSAIEKSPVWENSVVIVTFDENGGWWDHVPPPTGDRWGPGVRVPTIVISPFAKKNFVDHTTYDGTSILKLIETRFGLEPLGSRDAKANNMLNALELD